MICPLKLDMYCNNNTETALHAAVKGKHYEIAVALINAGANPNLIIKPYHDINEVFSLFISKLHCILYYCFLFQTLSCCSVEEDSSYGQSTALVEACKNRDVMMVDLLLKHSARDDDCKALAVVVHNKDETLTAKLLSTKVKILTHIIVTF